MVLFIIIFLTLLFITALALGLAQAVSSSRQKNQVRTMLRRAESPIDTRRPDLLKPEATEDPFRKSLDGMSLFTWLSSLIQQAGLDWTVYKLLGMIVAGGIIGALAGRIFAPHNVARYAPILLGLLGAFIPFKLVLRKRSKRLFQFEEQFPESLNFLSRAMRAGHAFSIGLEMLVADAPEPTRTCFALVLNDLRLGSSLETALGKLVADVPLLDVRFFVSSVLLQQGSGGNLSEILDSMAGIIRERFRLKGHVQAASAHGRVTGAILALMPIVVGFLMFLVSPDYVMVLFHDPTGKRMLISAIIGQGIGWLCIRKIINIRV